MRPTATTRSSTRCASACSTPDELVRATAAGPGQPRRAVRRRDRPRRHRRRERARLAGSRRGARRQAPERPDRRSVHGEEAARVLARAGRARSRGLAAGSRRRRPRVVDLRDGRARRCRPRGRARGRPAARGRDAPVRDHDLGVAGAHGSGRRAGPPGRRRGRVRPPRAAVHGDRRVVEGEPPRCRRTGEVVGDLPVAALADAPRYPLEPRGPTPSPTRRSRRRRSPSRETPPRSCSGCSPARTCAPRHGSTPSTTSSSARAPCSGPGGDAAVVRLTPSSARSRWPSTATVPAWRSIRAAAAARRSRRPS